MAYEIHPDANNVSGGTEGGGGTESGGTSPSPSTSSQYNVPEIKEERYDFKNVVNSSKDGVTYYVAELVVKCGAFSFTTVTIFCHLTIPNKPVSNVLFYSLHTPPKHDYKEDDASAGTLSIDAAGNIRYTQTSTDVFDSEQKTYGIATQITYWSHD